MRKFVNPLFAILFFHYAAFAQKTLPDFGRIDKVELELKSCPFEPDAPAMNIFDIQEVEFKPDPYVSRLVTERRVRIKIFKEAGYKYATIRIPYFSKRGVTKFKELSGVIYNLDSSGNIVVQKLERKDFFKEKAENNLGIVNFTFPNVKPGSVIEFTYTRLEKNVFDIDPWVVQDEIPTAYASTILITPTTSQVREKIYGVDTIAQKEELLTKGGPDRNKKTYFCENIKSFRPEPFMSSYKDNLLKVVFLLVPRTTFLINAVTSPEAVWEYTGKRLLNSLYWGQQIDKSIPGTSDLIDSAKKFASVSQRIAFIYQAVKKRAPDKPEQSLFIDDDISEAWNNKTGNTAELNLILLNLLKKANVESYPLLVSTRNHGKINKDFPSVGQLNGVDVFAIDSNKLYIMDAGLKYQSFQNPPPNILNRICFSLVPNNMKWVLITDDRPLLRQISNITAELKESGSLEGTATIWSYDYAKSLTLDSSDHDKEDRFFDKRPEGLKVVSVKQENAEDMTQPLSENVDFTFEPQATNNFYFINPQFLFTNQDNPFTKDSRNTDIDFGSNQQFNVTLRLTIPPSFEVEELPKNTLVRAPDTSFSYRRVFSSNGTTILMQQTFEIKRSVFDKEDYPAIKEFFSRVYALMNEEIVLKKK